MRRIKIFSKISFDPYENNFFADRAIISVIALILLLFLNLHEPDNIPNYCIIRDLQKFDAHTLGSLGACDIFST